MPKSKLLSYHLRLDKAIIKAVAQVMHLHVKKALKMKEGEVNHVYKIVTDNNKLLLARIFRNKHWPHKEKLPWVEKQLRKHKIPHAKILYYSRGNKFFPNGFMVSEFITGKSGTGAVRAGQLTLAQAFEHIGRALKKVHAIQLKTYGNVPTDKNNSRSYANYMLKNRKKSLQDFKNEKVLPQDLFIKIRRKIKPILEKYQRNFKPVLVHSDANRGNGIWGTDKKWYLIDWDNALARIWVEDYAELLYWTDWRRNQKFARQKYLLIQKHFFKGYGKVALSLQQLNEIVRALHILKSVNMLHYYYFDKKNRRAFSLTLKKLGKLLQN